MLSSKKHGWNNFESKYKLTLLLNFWIRSICHVLCFAHYFLSFKALIPF